MKEIPFQIQAHFSNIKSMSNSWRLQFDTQENMKPGHIARLMELHNNVGWLTFNVHMIEAENLIELPPIKKTEKKSSSQRLREVLFRLWETQSDGESFDDFYNNYMNALIEKIKERL